MFGELAEDADSAYAKQRLSRILKSLDTLEKRVQEIEEDALVSGSYETNMESLELKYQGADGADPGTDPVLYLLREHEHGGSAGWDP